MRTPSATDPPAGRAARHRFTPVRPLRRRRTGWTAERQRAFIAALAQTGCVAQAARTVGLSATSAYNLRRRPNATSFARAWDAALADARQRALTDAIEAALTPTLTPRAYRGNFTGSLTRHHDAGAMLAAFRALDAAFPTAKVEK